VSHRSPRARGARHAAALPLRLALALLVVAGLVAACNPNYMSASVGVVVPAPWGGVTVGTSVPIGYGW